jgi:hypothetical protein
VFSQESDSITGNNIIEQLDQAYNQFDHQRSAELLNAAFNSLDQFSVSDRVEVYKYAAFIAFQNSNNTLTSNHFWSLLELDPNYVLDPVTTSPKLLTLFQKTKIEFLEDMNRRLEVIEGEKNETDFAWRAFIFPGWEQWHRGYQTKGSILVSAGLISVGGLVYSSVMASQKRNDYLDSQDPEEIAIIYDEYNTHYQRQFYFAYAFIALWSISQLDLALWSQPRLSLGVTFHAPTFKKIYPAATLKIQR